MTTLGEKAKAYEPKQIKTVAELELITTNMEIKSEKEAEFPYDYIEVNGERYKVPTSVISAINEMIADNPELTSFKVKKSGEGLKTKYTTIPIVAKK